MFGPSAVPLVLVELCVCLCVLPYSWLRNLRLQAWFSTLANILNVVSDDDGAVVVVVADDDDGDDGDDDGLET